MTHPFSSAAMGTLAGSLNSSASTIVNDALVGSSTVFAVGLAASVVVPGGSGSPAGAPLR